jgi:hypothetical protein
MPSLFDGLKRVIQGKPVYDSLDNQQATQGQSDTQPQPLQQEPTINVSDSRTFPVVYVKRTVTRRTNGQMEVRSTIVNDSVFEIELEKVQLCGKELELKHELRPREEREFLLYEGPCMQSNREYQAILEYKIPNSTYFEAVHDIRYMYNPDKTYSVDEIRLHPPIRRMYS